MSTSEQLLREYAQTKSEAAFAEIVRRHVDLVYGSALRLLREPAAAEDVTQTTFAELARTAKQFAPGMAVAGWLYRHACFTALKTLRGDRRRQSREIAASTMTAPDSTPDHAPELEALTTALDETVHELESADRDAIVLRYFEKRGLREVGEALGVSEDTAQKRVSRAVDKLRDVLERRGFAITGSALAAALMAQAMEAAPLGLAAKIAASTLVGTGLTLAGLWKIAAGLVLVGGLAGVFLHQQYTQKQLADQKSTPITYALGTPMQAGINPFNLAELERLRKEHSELLTLRGESTLLRNQLTTLSNQLDAAEASNAIPPKISIECKFIEAPPSAINRLGLGLLLGGSHPGLLTQAQARVIMTALEKLGDVQSTWGPPFFAFNGKPASLQMPLQQWIATPTGAEEPEFGHKIKLTPTILPDNRTMSVACHVTTKSIKGYDPVGREPLFDEGSFDFTSDVPDNSTLILVRNPDVKDASTDDGQTRKSLIVMVTLRLSDGLGRPFYPPTPETAKAN